MSELIFTSGTEATPKAVMHTENTANFSVRTAYDWLGLDASDSVWMPSPIGHSTGFNYGVRFALFHGLKLVLQETSSAAGAIDLLERERCTYTLAATTFLQDLVGLATERNIGCRTSAPSDVVGPRYRGARAGGGRSRHHGPASLRCHRVSRRHLEQPRCHFRTARPDRRRHAAGSRGSRPRRAGQDCPPGQPGEVFIEAEHMRRLLADPSRTTATIDADGWCRSGDLGVLDDTGYLTLVGRQKDMIIRGGLNIAPREIEDALLTLPRCGRPPSSACPTNDFGRGPAPAWCYALTRRSTWQSSRNGSNAKASPSTSSRITEGPGGITDDGIGQGLEVRTAQADRRCPCLRQPTRPSW